MTLLSQAVTIVSIDPGACTGWAIGSPSPLMRLRACGVVYPDKGERVRLGPGITVDLLLIEKPVLTPIGPGSIIARANGLITCWGRGCRVVEAIPHRRYEEVAPGTWKGQVDKDIHNQRVLAKLTAAERALVSKNHNEIDAVGLLLYALERWYR